MPALTPPERVDRLDTSYKIQGLRNFNRSLVKLPDACPGRAAW
jgi:hypothetical protein